MRKIRYFLHPLTLSLALIYFQTIFFLPSFYSFSYNFVSYFMINAVFMGVLFGVMGCPGCVLPLTMSLAFYHSKPRKTIFPAVIFNVMRLLSIFLYSLSVSLSFNVIKKIVYPQRLVAFNGMIMIVFSFIVFKHTCFKTQLPFLRKTGFKNILWLYALWGFVLGFPCGVEATGFLVYLNSYPATPFLHIVAMLIFSIFSVLPVVLLILVLYSGFNKISSIWLNFSIYLRNFAFFYLFLMGSVFVAMLFL